DYFFEHHAATLLFFVHQGGGTLETMFGPIEFRKGDFLIVPKGVTHRFELAPGPQYYWVYESFAGDPEKSEAPTTGQFITHSRSDYKFPRTLDTRNEAGRFEIVSKVAEVYTRRVHLTHPFDVVRWRGDHLPDQLAVYGRAPARRRPLARAALGPHDLQAPGLLHLRLHRALGREGRDVAAVLPPKPRLPRDDRLPLWRFLQRRRRGHGGDGDAPSGRPAA